MTERAYKQARRSSVERIVGLTTAAEMLGSQRALGDALSIGERAVRAKLQAERGITYTDLALAAKYLRVRATRLTEHAAKLDALAGEVAGA